VDSATLETKVFNDIVRDVFKKEALPKLKEIKGWLIVYFGFTMVNFFIDIIDFLYCLAQLGNNSTSDTYYLCFFMISIIYLSKLTIKIVIDLAYIFWNHSLKYTFPHEIMDPITELYSGVLSKLKDQFKLKKNSPSSTNADVREINHSDQPQRTPQVENLEIHPHQQV
jgi:hypothetical protein